jgi:hypothetical protein
MSAVITSTLQKWVCYATLFKGTLTRKQCFKNILADAFNMSRYYIEKFSDRPFNSYGFFKCSTQLFD